MIRHLLFFSLLFFSLAMHGQNPSYLEDLRQKWENSCAYTLEIARQMPAEAYSFRPTEDQMSFQEQLLHTLKNMTWLCQTFLGGEKFAGDLKRETYSKDEVLTLMESTYQYTFEVLDHVRLEQLEEPVNFFTDQVRNKGQILTLLHDHHTHHRGQLIVYLRLQEQDPPKFRGW